MRTDRHGSANDRDNAPDAHLRSLLDAAPFAIIEVALDGTVLLWNRAAEEILGWTAGEVLGEPLPFTSEGIEGERDAMAEVIVSGESLHDMVLERHRKDGSKVVLSGAAAPIRDEHGVITSVIAIGTDITEQQRLHQELLQAQRMEAVGRLAGGVAHDFNNLLTAILGNVEFLLEEIHDPDHREDLEAIRRAASRGSALTEQLLAVGRRQLMHPAIVDLNEVALAMRPVLRRLLRDDVTLSVRTAPAASTVKADPAQIEQVLLNLAVNARDAIPRGGKVFVEIENAELGPSSPERPRELEPGPYVRMTVRDTGIGMDDHTRIHAFDPFFTTKPPGQGVGLGLAAVYGIVTQSGGHIGITSAPDEGTTFLIHLPRTAEDVAVPPPSPEAHPQPARERVLLVEDDRSVREVCRQVLERAGYQVLEAGDGHEALAVARRADSNLDLLVSDIVLPGLDGIELATMLGEERVGLRVLLISGYAERLTIEGLPGDVQADVLAKPFSPAELTRRVRAVLDA